ncbi:ThiF family adenylyltransferase [Paenibacillus marchantiae]|uniref:ThiF family adenylyltransferase n=1 Tax=Paenibacillus marchantiae TaxID=3026433 RepID=UPI00237BC105|nr:ThiF family adenylyltransferase [Paenibacillus marchantiae]WDQ32153.1 ThiF family adenylyltransferase [Paenibacillus marchantiae]
MTEKNILPEPISFACSHLEVLEGYEQLEDMFWFEKLESWVLHFSIIVPEVNQSSISLSTQWYMLIDPLYPRGSISIYPDKNRSIINTYHHQNENIATEDYPWRWGKICTDWDNGNLDRLSDNEELLDAEHRIYWHVERLKLWIVAASNGSLMKEGDHFELPHISFTRKMTEKIVFAEEYQHLNNWNSVKSRSGLLSLRAIKQFPDIIFVSQLVNNKSEVVQSYDWGKLFDVSSDTEQYYGVWLLLHSHPTLSSWSYPKTIEELDFVCRLQQIDLWKEVYDSMHTFRERDRNFILIGFPIPQIIGQENQVLHWIAIEIPKLSKKVKKVKGFRKVNDYYFLIDRLNELKPSKELRYLPTENWSKEAILSRGSLNKEMQQDSIFLIGAGALGSAIGELLSRTGVSKITICDEDTLKIGNLSRHILGLEYLSSNKAESLSFRINKNNLHIRSSAITSRFPNINEEEVDCLENHDVVIDTTGSDTVINHLNLFDWTLPKRFISISLGFGAKRMFLLLSNKHPFPRKTFFEFLQPWLALEREENKDTVLPREGIGCYHPLFPARLDDIWTMAGLAIKEMEAWWPDSFGSNIFAVYEHQQFNGMPAGVILKQREVF